MCGFIATRPEAYYPQPLDVTKQWTNATTAEIWQHLGSITPAKKYLDSV